MATDITRIINELNRTLNNIYEISKRVYDVYLDDQEKDVQIPYTDINNDPATKTIPNVAKIYGMFDNIVQNMEKYTSVINLIPDPGFTGSTDQLSTIIRDPNITVTVQAQDLTPNDKTDISLLFDKNIFEHMHGNPKKLVINISNPTGISDDIKLVHTPQQNPFINVFHQDSIEFGCIYRIDGARWTNDITKIKPASRTPDTIVEFDIGSALSTFEIFLPYAYSKFNNGLPVSYNVNLVGAF